MKELTSSPIGDMDTNHLRYPNMRRSWKGVTRMSSLRSVRVGMMLSQRDLAREAGVTQKTIVDLELGRIEPRLQTMRKIAAALGVGPREIDEFRRAIEVKVAA
jgi:DNA-binding XRE family transcriptional regulator